ncbi:hypothetical protein LEP1GSC103_3659 [Leptospira borgpetersenii serovar Javanica str. UI 09931]|uniref:Uncharacterized protein n=4 Tax=Leptospira borgpetersenii TaxID=174 RepID=M3GYE1_LEPBO|nr:hypothetical protein LEP1GSC128_0735 [Leptospira borgpetersenii str. 200801926]EKQ93305.1 hypothetical protein LEP1GSC101_3797 [Leptospira borgpetersenii str. UI 09149]EMF99863.1 hypothetical protein LEP1GSC123_3522 [Leptospira borgpetersenii str. 200701203]EMK09131.1 hypothetical protein LEP1GSC066_0211 [Leptospira sp. serovar Kenya str. Sh9]EMN15080.1 hypothetical protein LEP1GSC055_1652 [Leptospira borgpetersenii str. Brem 307]EMN17280.1 hypothetical protein LEP1GSC056_1375 [Leptospira b
MKIALNFKIELSKNQFSIRFCLMKMIDGSILLIGTFQQL